MRQQHPDRTATESILEHLARTLLYEGYALFPYHRSAVKNLKPIPVGIVYPQDYQRCCPEAAALMQTECILTGPENMVVGAHVRFLHLREQQVFKSPETTPDLAGNVAFERVDVLETENNRSEQGWDAIERKVDTGAMLLSQLLDNEQVFPLSFPETKESEDVFTAQGGHAGKRLNVQRGIQGSVRISACRLEDCFKIKVTLENSTAVDHPETAGRDDIYPLSFMSAHIVLNTDTGAFISAQEPDARWDTLAAQCRNILTYPILVDESNTTVLASPIILYDYPKIDPRSTGDLFDCSEIEEALLLHIAVLSDDEKQRIAQSDDKLRAMLQRVEMVTPEEILRLHGGMRGRDRDEG